MPIRKRFRRTAFAAGIILGLLTAIWFSMPLWLPWVLGPLTRSQGIRFQRYERLGYHRFALHDLRLTNQNLTIKATEVEAFVPNTWLWRLITDQTPVRKSFAELNGLEVAIHLKGGGKTSTSQDVHQGLSALQVVRRWVPLVTVTNGTLLLSGASVKIPGLVWSDGKVHALVSIPRFKQPATLSADLRNPGHSTIEVTARELSSSIQVGTNATGFDLDAITQWAGNLFTFAAHFGQRGKLPESAELSGTNLTVSAETARLPNYEDPRGNATAKWEKGQFTVDIQASARPFSTETNLPPLELTLRMGGNTNTAVIREARVSAPWMYAELSRELSVFFKGQLLREPANLRISADLGGQPWVPLQGTLNGEAQFTPDVGKYPRVVFRATGQNVGDARLQAAEVEAIGSLEWPKVRLDSGRARFADGSDATAKGYGNLMTRNIEEAVLGFSGPLVKRWLPAGYSYDSLSVEGRLRGSPTNLIHAGTLKAKGIQQPRMRPLGVEVTWEGRQLNLDAFHLRAAAGSSLLSIDGALSLASKMNLIIKTASLRKADQNSLVLQDPSGFALGRSSVTHLTTLQLEPLHLTGSAGELQIQGGTEWPRSGWLRCSARNLQPNLLEDFLVSPLPEIRLNNLSLNAGWTNAPVVFDLDLELTIITNPVLNAAIQLTGNQTGVVVRRLVVNDGDSPVVQGQGFLPLALNPANRQNAMLLPTNAALEAELSSEVRGPWVESLLKKTGFRVVEPRLSAKLSGSWQKPVGTIQASAQRLERLTTDKTPAITDLQVAIELDRHEIRLTSGHLFVQDQPVTIRGSLPLEDQFLRNLSKKQLPDWRLATAEVQGKRVNLAVLAELYPDFISPQGTIELNVRLEKGGVLSGFLRVEDARTRPLPELGPARDIQLKVRFENRTLHIQDTTARIGGALVNVGGHIDLSGTNWFKEKLPPFALAIGGKKGTARPPTRNRHPLRPYFIHLKDQWSAPAGARRCATPGRLLAQ